MGSLGPVPTHDLTVGPRPFFSNSLTTPCRPPCCSMMPLTTDTMLAPTIPPSTPSNSPISAPFQMHHGPELPGFLLLRLPQRSQRGQSLLHFRLQPWQRLIDPRGAAAVLNRDPQFALSRPGGHFERSALSWPLIVPVNASGIPAQRVLHRLPQRHVIATALDHRRDPEEVSARRHWQRDVPHGSFVVLS